MPCYNEEQVITESYRRTKAAMEKLSVSTEIIYINDGSRDKTREILNEIASRDPHVKVIHFSRNFGHQPAVRLAAGGCPQSLELAFLLLQALAEKGRALLLCLQFLHGSLQLMLRECEVHGENALVVIVL